MSSGANHTCVIDSAGVKCWGRNDKKQIEVPQDIVNPHSIVAHGDRTCVTDQKGVVCWGERPTGRIQFPVALKSPTAVDFWTVNDSVCVIDDGQVKCTAGLLASIDLKNPRLLGISGELLCVAGDEEVKCREFGRNGINLKPAPVKFANSLSVLGDSVCATGEGEIKCWGARDDLRPIKIPSFLRNVQYVTTGRMSYGGGACTIDDSGIKCWEFEGFVFRENNYAPNPTVVSKGDRHTCAIVSEQDVKGIRCWGNNDFGQLNVPVSIRF